MNKRLNTKFPDFLIGVILGVALVALGAVAVYKKHVVKEQLKSVYRFAKKFQLPEFRSYKHHFIEDFDAPIPAQSGKRFGPQDQFAFELFRNGTFIIDGRSGHAWQKSDSYRDSSFIRSSQPLPKTYKISVTVGAIDYGLEKIRGVPKDPEYSEGPQGENGCYLLAIVDELPKEHQTNIWWHQHRKVVIDVDNNTGGNGMPNPVFMVYFDNQNQLMAMDEVADEWTPRWTNALRYDPKEWYRVEIEKTDRQFILSVYSSGGDLLKRGKVDIKDVWRGQGQGEYFVVGEPHENYYQGSMRIDTLKLNY